MFFIFKLMVVVSILMYQLNDFHVNCKPFTELNEDIVESDRPNSNISLSILEVQDQQERPDTSEISIIDDCGTVPWTELLNLRPIVDYKYAYFHHDDDDVHQSTTDFIDENNLKPNILCTGSACDAINE